MVKQLVKIVLIITAICTALCAAACAKNGSYPSAASVAGDWLEIKRDLNTDAPASHAAQIAAHIEEFRLTVEEFLASPVGTLYKVHRPDEMLSFAAIIPSVEQLETAVLGGDDQAIFSLALEIDTNIDLLRNIDESLSSTSLLHYFQLLFFLVILIITIILVLRILYSRLDTAEKQEQQSLNFTRETIIAQEQERGRIARELHDTVAQDLWRLSFQTDSIGKADDAAERSRLCAEVVSEQKELMRRIRGICDNLIPPDFQRRGLADSLGSLCSNFRQKTGIGCQLTIQKNLRLASLDGDTQLQCFRIVQECLANIEKHAQTAAHTPSLKDVASETRGSPLEASVLVRREEDNSLFVCVSDNGRGFSPPNRDSSRRFLAEGHFGLWSMYERAASLLGNLSIDSSEGEGTMITLKIPFITRGGGGRK